MKKKLFLLLLGASLLISGCGQNVGKNLKNKSETAGDEELEIDTEPLTLGAGEEEFLDLETYSVENSGSTDAQTEFVQSRAASSETGIYYWEGGMLMYYDKAAQISVPLCNRPDCAHDNNDCNASFNLFVLGSIEFYKSEVFYYDGSVYIIGHDMGNMLNLYKVAADGSSWEEYMEICKASVKSSTEGDRTSTSVSHPDVYIHRGYVYFLFGREAVPTLRRIKLGGTEIETVCESTGEKSTLWCVKPYGDFIFFQEGSYVGEDLYSGIYAFNTNTGEITLVKNNVLRNYEVVDNILYYEKNDKINKYDLVTGEDTELPLSCTSYDDYFVDDKGIYIFHEKTGGIDMYDHEGDELCQITDETIDRCYFGADGLFLAKHGSSKAVLDVEDLLKGDGKWIYTDEK